MLPPSHKAPLLLATLLCAGLAAPGSPPAQAQAPQIQAPQTQDALAIADFARPILFAYGSWEGTARTEGGRLLLSVPDSKGGAGDNYPEGKTVSLAEVAEMSPALRLKIGAGNKARSLRLMLRDAAGGNATWNFSLEGLKNGTASTCTPQDGDSLRATWSTPRAWAPTRCATPSSWTRAAPASPRPRA